MDHQPQPRNAYPYCLSPQFTYYPPQSQNPNAETQEFPAETALAPSRIDSYASLSLYPHGNGAYIAPAQASLTYDPPQTVGVAGRYSDPDARNWSIKEAIRLYGVDPAAYAGTDVTVASNGITQLSNHSPTLWVNPNAQSHVNHNWNKHQEKAKTSQPAYCEICQVECASKDVLEYQHKLGKRHKKNLEKLKNANRVIHGASTGLSNPEIGPQENPSKGRTIIGEKSSREGTEPEEDLETKRMKILEDGAQQNPTKGRTINGQSSRKAAQPEEDLETKRRKLDDEALENPSKGRTFNGQRSSKKASQPEEDWETKR